ncbi:unnamed protein product, partial [Pelagomonas calceolata]
RGRKFRGCALLERSRASLASLLAVASQRARATRHRSCARLAIGTTAARAARRTRLGFLPRGRDVVHFAKNEPVFIHAIVARTRNGPWIFRTREPRTDRAG